MKKILMLFLLIVPIVLLAQVETKSDLRDRGYKQINKQVSDSVYITANLKVNGSDISSRIDSVSTALQNTASDSAFVAKLDTIIGETKWINDDIVIASKIAGGDLKGETVFSNATSSQNLTDAYLRFCIVVVKEDAIWSGVQFNNDANADFTADETNCITIKKLSAGKDSILALGQTANDATMYNVRGMKRIDFITPFNVSKGDVLFVSPLWNNSASVTAPKIFGKYMPSNDHLGIGVNSYYYKVSVTTPDANYKLSEMSGSIAESAIHYEFKFY